jgi:hypothetical protein
LEVRFQTPRTAEPMAAILCQMAAERVSTHRAMATRHGSLGMATTKKPWVLDTPKQCECNTATMYSHVNLCDNYQFELRQGNKYG